MAFTPRLTDTGMLNNHIWYSGNPFYTAGYGLPNCTCYCWGRCWEISDPLGSQATKPTLPTSDAGTWYDRVDTSVYQKSSELNPVLGAIICFSDDNGGAGHVATVEEIMNNGETIVCSNSAWGGQYFYLTTLTKSNNYKYSHFTFQGFIYHPDYPPSPTPVTTGYKKGFKWVLFHKAIMRNRNMIFFDKK